jgi:hypothetical protein
LTIIRIFEENELLNNTNDTNVKASDQKSIKTKGITLIYFNQAASQRKKIFSIN